jgi:hypothetical protein
MAIVSVLALVTALMDPSAMGGETLAERGEPVVVTVDGRQGPRHNSGMMRPLTAALIVAGTLLATGVVATPAQASSCGKTAYADGTVGPSVCPDGGANEAVAKAYAKATPAVMALDHMSTRKQIQAAVCKDRDAGATGESLYDAIEYQAADHDWRRSIVNEVNRRLVAGRYC